MKNTKHLVYFFVFAAVLLRVLRHYEVINLPPNFAPIAAMALFSGTYFLDRKQALIVPFIAMIISDAFIGLYNPFVMLSVYLCFTTTVLIGFYIKNNKTLTNIIGGSLLSSVVFYLVTNFAVWGFGNWYPFTASGLMQSYIMAVPFFKWTLLGDLFYVTVMFGSYELVSYYLFVNKQCTLLNTK
ncbi:MAG: hypothetical protein ACD_58C00287G0002 [uncultured bacterium]|nr:MAG: hypothetical protein ACD_58C00287G0002 [uncultured bacterium]